MRTYHGLSQKTGDLGERQRAFACFWIVSLNVSVRCFSVSFFFRLILALSSSLSFLGLISAEPLVMKDYPQ
jgi:hypothetical protein